MQFLYTGATTFQGPQNNPNLSLGGYISGSPVPNNKLNNLFSDFSWGAVQQKRVEIRALVLRNTLGFDATDVLFGYIYPTTVGAAFDLQVAFVALTPGQTSMERIPEGSSAPIYATFEEANINPSASVDNSIDIGALPNGASIALWLQLSLITPLTPPTFASLSDEIAWWQNVSQPALNAAQNIQIQLKYTYNQ